MAERQLTVTFATLMNQKVAIRSANSPHFAVEEHFFYTLMTVYVSKISFDEQWYLTKYPDIKAAIVNGAVASGAEHYRRFGYFEHRMPYNISVDEAFYLKSYPDVKAGVDAGHFSSGLWHFETLGFREGRLPHAGFALRTVQ